MRKITALVFMLLIWFLPVRAAQASSFSPGSAITYARSAVKALWQEVDALWIAMADLEETVDQDAEAIEASLHAATIYADGGVAFRHATYAELYGLRLMTPSSEAPRGEWTTVMVFVARSAVDAELLDFMMVTKDGLWKGWMDARVIVAPMDPRSPVHVLAEMSTPASYVPGGPPSSTSLFAPLESVAPYRLTARKDAYLALQIRATSSEEGFDPRLRVGLVLDRDLISARSLAGTHLPVGGGSFVILPAGSGLRSSEPCFMQRGWTQLH